MANPAVGGGAEQIAAAIKWCKCCLVVVVPAVAMVGGRVVCRWCGDGAVVAAVVVVTAAGGAVTMVVRQSVGANSNAVQWVLSGYVWRSSC